MIIDVSNKEYVQTLDIYENSILYFKSKFSNFDINKLDILLSEIFGFEIKYSYSYDNVNWSNPLLSENWELVNTDFQNTELEYIFLSIWFYKHEKESFETNTLYISKNNENTEIQCVKISEIKYDNKVIDILQEKNFNLVTYNTVINKLPKWNFYDNQSINIRRWLDQCISISKMYGHTAIYFKTEPIETNHTFANHVLRNVTAIKKILVMSPGNELPQDRNIYTEWDMPMEGDFVIHIVNELFKNAFGENKVPLSKDYLYLPIINKLFRVSSVQPKNGFMGKIGWWETFLTKYEDDETITISEDLKEIYSGIDGFDFEENDFKVIDELGEFLEDKVISKEKLQEKNIDEKKLVTDNFSNRIVDSTSYIDLKETDAQREFYSKRLEITSINPDENAFPVTMYDCTTVNKRVVALTYNLVDLTSINKKTLLVENFEFSFNFVLLGKFTGEIFDINNKDNFSLITFDFNRQNLSIIFHKYQKTYKIAYKFEINEFYQILIKFNEKLKQLSISIIMLKNKEKNIEFQDLYIINSEFVNQNILTEMELKSIYLFGGSFLINEIIFKINNNKIISDNVNPVLIMNQFGLQ